MTMNLRTYLDELSQLREELINVRKSVDPHGEISAVVKATEFAGKPAVHFHSVVGSELSVLMGVFGTRERLATSIGVEKRQLVPHVLDLLKQPLPSVVHVNDPPIDERILSGDSVDLDILPVGVHSRDDAGKYITSGVVISREPSTSKINSGMYRLMVTGKNTLTVNAAPDHDLGRIFASAAKQGEDVPIAIVIGHHPAYSIASQLKNPVSIDCHELAGALGGEPLRVADGATIDLEVPADAEIVLEGIVSPSKKVKEGPFGEFTYYYGEASAPECTVTAIRYRSDAIFHDLHPTHDEHRCLWLFPGREARLFDAVKRAAPGLKEVRIPFHGGSLSAYISITKMKDGDSKQAILAAFASDHFLKYVYIVDDDIDIFNESEVMWSVNVRTQVRDDLTVLPHMKGIRMDPSARPVGPGGDRFTDKFGIDATRPLYGSFPDRADLPFQGFEDIAITDYVEPAEASVFSNANYWRRRLDE